MIELEVEDVLVRLRPDVDEQRRVPPDAASVASDKRVVILKEADGERRMPIWTGAFEGDMIALGLRLRAGSAKLIAATSPPRPMSHDLMAQLIRTLGGAVGRIKITGRRDATYYARVEVATAGGSEELDARPSDALALAVRTEVPIVVDEDVFAEAGRPQAAVMEELGIRAPPGKWQSLLAAN